MVNAITGKFANYFVVRNRKGFTLVELLVVICVIMLLAAILFPVLASAREQALTSDDISNLRQIGIAVRMYQQDYGEFPGSIGGLFSYVMNRRIFISPFQTVTVLNPQSPPNGKPPCDGPCAYGDWPGPGGMLLRSTYDFNPLVVLAPGQKKVICPDCAVIYEQHPSDYPFAFDMSNLEFNPVPPFLCGFYSRQTVVLLRGDGRVSTWHLAKCSPEWQNMCELIKMATGERPGEFQLK